MRPADLLRPLLLAPLFLYLTVYAGAAVHPLDPVLALGAVLAMVPIVPVLFRRSEALAFAAAPTALALVGLYAFATGTPFQGWTASLDAGVLIAAPIWFLAVAIDGRDEPGTSAFGLIAGAAVGIMLLAAGAQLVDAPSAGPPAFLNAVGTVLHDQATAIGTLVAGSVPSTIPLSHVSDPVFSVLAVLAALGIVAPWLDGPGLATLREREPTGTIPSPDAGALSLPPRLDARLDEGSSPVEPAGVPLFTVLPLLAGALSALGFIALASAAPRYALLVVAIGAAAAVFALAAWAIERDPTRRLRPSLTAPARSSARPK